MRPRRLGARRCRPGHAPGLGVQGARVFGLEIALTAFDNGASEIWTLDGRFVTVPGLDVKRPI